MSPRRARTGGDRELRLEVLVVPVSGLDRAKAFYPDRAAFVVDHDTPVSDTARVVQLTRRARRARQ